MLFGQGPADGKAKSQTTKLFGNLFAPLLEGVEDSWKHFGIDSDAGIGDGNFEFIRRCVFCADKNAAVVCGKFDRIFDQVPEDLLQAGGVSEDGLFFGGEFDGDVQIFLLQVCLANAKHMIDGLVYGGWFAVEFELASADAGKVEEVVDQLNFKLDVSADHLDGFGNSLGRLGSSSMV